MNSALALLAEWMPHQRWYSSKGSAPELRLLESRQLPSAPGADAVVMLLIVVDESASPPITYQVPIVRRSAASAADSAHRVGVGDDGTVLVDGPHDIAYTTVLQEQLALGPQPMTANVLTGEQSNTSIVFRPRSAPPVICKLFRQLNPGVNPDIELQTALAQAGSAHVPRAVGHLEGSWPDPARADSTITGSLAFAQEFLPDVEDAWRVALRAAASGESFTVQAHALGAATADVHLSLARLFPTGNADEAARGMISGAWQRRLAIATAEVPGLGRHRQAIAAVYERAMSAPWPPLQRVHGDYHLGQVLHVPRRGWVLLDFEGEPMRPIRERMLPDSALRDVAGMLRSFDYVAGSLERDGAASSLSPWARASRVAFLGGYEHRTGAPATGPLLDAFELDKAVYEAIYEGRNRPGWLGIPLSAIDRLVGSE